MLFFLEIRCGILLAQRLFVHAVAAQMLLHQPVRTLGVAGEDGLHDGAVIRHVAFV